MIKKKALSPQTSGVLLAILTIMIVIIIVLWLLGFFSESILKFNAPIEESCNKARFKASLVNAEGSGFPELQLSNIGSIPILDFNIKYIKGNGKAETEFIGRALDPGNSISLDILLNMTIETKSIEIYPVLLGQTKSKKNKQKICFDFPKTIPLNQPIE
jgi:hypothetical protein